MRILVVNVNTRESMTEAIRAQAVQSAGTGTEIVALTPFFGPESCEGNLDSHLAAIGVLDRVLAYKEPYNAVVQAGFGEHGREALQEVLHVPVIDITEAAAHLACLLGHRYSVVTTLDRAVPLIEDRLLLAGLDRRCASVRATGLGVLELEQDHARTLEAITEQAARAVRDDHAEVICLGCGGMAGLDSQLAGILGVPVIDGVAAAVKLAEALHGLGMSTSKVRTYASPRAKTIHGWPLHREADGAYVRAGLETPIASAVKETTG